MALRIIAALLLALIAASPGRSLAHPLGNFSINQYSAIRLDKNEIAIRYVIDIAEIPTFQEMQETGLVPKIGDPGVETYASKKIEVLRSGLVLELDGKRVALQAKSHEIIFPEGAGGLPTIKLGILYGGKIAAAGTEKFEAPLPR